MESEINAFGNILDNFNSKLNQVTKLRRLLDEELLEVEMFFNSKSQVIEKVKSIHDQINQIFEEGIKSAVLRQLKQFEECQEQFSIRIADEINNFASRIRQEHSRAINQKDSQLQKNSMIIRNLREQIALMKLKNPADSKQNSNTKNCQVRQMRVQEKENMRSVNRSSSKLSKERSERNSESIPLRVNKNIDNIRDIFRLQRLSVDQTESIEQQVSTPFKFVKTVFPSPQLQDSSISPKEELIDISPSSIKKQSPSLFYAQSLNSKKKSFLESCPFEVELSIVENSLDNSNNIFAKLTFGKDKAKYLKEQLVNEHGLDSISNGKSKDSELLQHLKNNIHKNQNGIENQKQEKTSLQRNMSVESSISAENQVNSSIINKPQEPKAERKRNKYLQFIKSQYTKESSSARKERQCVYLGEPSKQLRYEGLKREGKKYGRGMLYYSDGLSYEGDFVNNKREGFGILQFEHSEVYSGDWENDKAQGEGRLRNCRIIKSKCSKTPKPHLFSEWITYMGRFKENTFDGPGELHLENGEKFIGQFVNGRVEGQGTLYKSNGDVKFGLWKNNKLIRQI